MNTAQLSTATLDDIVFEGRNQTYGAYVLRRIYNRHLVTGLTFSVSLCLLLVALPFIVQRLWPAAVEVAPLPVEGKVIFDAVLLPKPAVRPAVPPQRHPIVVTPRPDVIPRVVKNPTLPPKPVETIATDPAVQAGPATSGPGVTTGPDTGVAGPSTDSGKAVTAPPAAPFLHVEVMPEFAGGTDALRKFLQRNLKYPRQALSNAISGKVYVAFTVQASGEIADVQILKGLGYGTDEEAARVIKAMPAWTPGRQNSHPVAVRYTLPITFHYE
jgi:protein TonB